MFTAVVVFVVFVLSCLGAAAQGDPGIVAQGDGGVVAQGDSGVVAQGDSGVVAQGDSGVVAQGDAGVVAQADSGVVAQGDAGVVAPGDAGLAVQGDAGVAAHEEYGATAEVTREHFEQARSRTIVQRSQADESAAGNVSEALELAHAMIVQRTASGSGTPFVRGLTGYQVLLMADDLRLNDALTRAGGSASINLIDPESLGSIEVIRGPASVLYGSDALGGVVHVRTQDTGAYANAAPDASASAAVRGATAEHALRGQGHARAVVGPFGVRVSGTRGYAGAIERGGDLGEQPFTGHQDWSFATKLELVAASRQRVSLSHQSGHLFDMPRPDVSTPEDRQSTLSLDRDASLLTYSTRLWDGRLRLRSFAGVSIRREVRERVRTARLERERDRVLAPQLGVRGSLLFSHGGGLELGFESSLERIASGKTTIDDAGTRRDRGRYVDGSAYDMFALYLLCTQPVTERLLLLVGTRSTMVHASAPTDPLFAELAAHGKLERRFLGTTGSIGVRHAVLPNLHLTASVLGGFRAPNFEDFQAFGGGARGFTVPNQALHEERSWTFEGGVEVDDRHWHMQAYAFASLLSGLVVRVPTTYQGSATVEGDPVITRRNASDGLLVGGELTATGKLDLGLYAGVSAFLTWGEMTRPDDMGREVREPATKVPPPVGVLRLGFDHPGSLLFAEGALTVQLPQERLSEGDRADVRLCPESDAVCKRVDGYTDVSLRAGARLNERLLLVFAAENLLDAAYKTYASGAYSPGRNFVVRLRGSI